ncbi:MAG: hypothetical protein AAF597_00860, partial [Bacteroidota bacterium]
MDVASQARRILSEQRSEAAIDLIAEALAVPMPDSDRELLLGALDAMAPSFPRAKSLSVTLRGLDAGSAREEVQRLAATLGSTSASDAVIERYEIEAKLERAASAAESAEASGSAAPSPEEIAAAETDRATAMLRLAVEPSATPSMASKRFTELRFLEAREAAQAAEAAVGPTWKTQGVLGLVSYYLGEADGWKVPVRAS